MDNRSLAQTVLKALEIMEVICDNQNCGVQEISEKVGLNRTTVHRLVATLENAGYVKQEKERGKYRATLRLYELGNKVIKQLNISKQAYPIMKKLSEETKETIDLAVREGSNIVYVQIIDSPQGLKVSAPVGSRPPLYCNASGKVILAYMPKEKIKALFPAEFNLFTPNTVKNIAELEAELDKVLANGYAVDSEGWVLNTTALAAPVWNYDHKVVAALTIAAPTIRMSPARIKELAQILTREAKTLSEKLGYRNR